MQDGRRETVSSASKVNEGGGTYVVHVAVVVAAKAFSWGVSYLGGRWIEDSPRAEKKRTEEAASKFGGGSRCCALF